MGAPKKKTTKQIELPTDDNYKPPVTGVGDILQKITSSMGIEACEECLKRKEALNNMWSFLRKTKRELTIDEVNYIKEIQKTNLVPESKNLFELYNSVFGTHIQSCLCPGVIKDMVFKLGKIIERDYDTLPK